MHGGSRLSVTRSAYCRFCQAASTEVLAGGERATFVWGIPEGFTLDWGAELDVEVLWSSREIVDNDLNNVSIVLRLGFTGDGNDISFMFTGDAEHHVEDHLITEREHAKLWGLRLRARDPGVYPQPRRVRERRVPMRWTVKLVAEIEPGRVTEQDVASFERSDRITPATLGLSIAEGKAVLATIQAHVVKDHITRHGQATAPCETCGHPRTSKDYYTSSFRSIFGTVPMRVRRFNTCPCEVSGQKTVSALFTGKYPVAPELRYLTAKLAALMPFGKVADFLDEVLPLSTKTHVSTVRNRTRRVGKRLLRSHAARARPPRDVEHLVVGLDGGYVRKRHRCPGRTFEVVTGRICSGGVRATRFAFVRDGTPAGVATLAQALREHGVTDDTRQHITVLSDGDGGLRAIQRSAAPAADHVLDWFHIAMRWQHVHQLATGLQRHGGSAEASSWLLDHIVRAKWALWNGQVIKTFRHLAELRAWTWTAPANEAWLRQLRTHLWDLTRYLDANADSLPDYGTCYRAGVPISTAFAESAVNEIIARRMIKKQQMRWNRDTVQPFLTVRVAVLNGALEPAFRSWHAGFRPVETPAAPLAA